MAFELPTRTDLPAYNYLIELDGVTYRLSYTYNKRMEKWLMSVSNEQGTLIVAPVPVVVNWPILGRFVQNTLPEGALGAYDSANTDTDPGRFDLGARVKMLYRGVDE